jgi:RNA polymerase sigma-70 factor (ECF subfamily)
MKPLPSNDAGKTLELLKKIQEGESEAWEELFRIYHDELLFSIRVQLGSHLRGFLQSEDVFQSVAMEAIKEAGAFEYRGEGSFRAYLHRMVQNKIRDLGDWAHAGKRAGGVPLSESILSHMPSKEVEVTYFDMVRFEPLEKCMASLPKEMQEVLILRKIQGWSSKEVAQKLNKSDAAIRKLLSRAMGRLTLLLNQRLVE